MTDQPYAYHRRELIEPDWRRFPGWAGVTVAEWESAQWQRAHCVKNVRQLREVAGAMVLSICGGSSIDMVARSRWSRSRSAQNSSASPGPATSRNWRTFFTQ